MVRHKETIVRLTWQEIHLCGNVAISRMVNNLNKGFQDRYGLSHGNSIGADMEFMGCLGEMAVAKYCDQFWSCLEVGAVDAGYAEVRTVGESNRRLILHKKDQNDAPCVLALVARNRLPEVVLRGWIFGKNGKRSKYWQDPGTGRPAYFVSTNDLRPMKELIQ